MRDTYTLSSARSNQIRLNLFWIEFGISLCTSACKPKLEKPIYFLASHPLAQAIAVILNQWYFCLDYNKWCKQLGGTKKASSSILTCEDFRKNKKLGATWSILPWKRPKLINDSYIVNALDWKGKAWHRIEWDRM